MTADALTAALNSPPAGKASTPAGKGAATITPDGVTITDATVTEPVVNSDWSHVLALFNLDADEFDVIDETVRCTTWQQSKGYEDGRRDTVQLYAYSFRAKKRTADMVRPEIVQQWRETLKVRSRAKPSPIIEDAGTYVILVADPQLGKKGTAQAVDNWQRGVTGHIDAARKLGPAVNALHVAYMGDETENVVNSYGNQPHTIELNRSRQLELDYDMRVWTMREALALRKPVTASSVISNHGEWTRNGGKEPVTTSNDNSSTHIARQVAKLFDELAPFTGRGIEWTIGDTHPGVTLNLSGARCYFSHGYVEKGRGPSVEVKTRSAIERQILGRTDDLGDVDLWFMAHYHHFYANEFEGRTLFGCPAIEAEKSSEYMLDQYGVWSPPGILGMLVGETRHRDGWSHLNVF